MHNHDFAHITELFFLRFIGDNYRICNVLSSFSTCHEQSAIITWRPNLECETLIGISPSCGAFFMTRTCFCLLLSLLLVSPALADDQPTPSAVFEQRILPIFKSPNPSSCVQCGRTLHKSQSRIRGVCRLDQSVHDRQNVMRFPQVERRGIGQAPRTGCRHSTCSQGMLAGLVREEHLVDAIPMHELPHSRHSRQR